MKTALAVAGALVGLYSLIPYIFDIIKKKTKPNIVSWVTWTILSAIAAAAAFAAGEPHTALLALAYTIGTFAIVLLGMKNGIAKFSLFDGLCQVGAIVGLILWLVFNSPDIAIIAVVVIDFIGVLPTLKHSWQAPSEETWQSFSLGVVAAILTILSIIEFNTASLLYPLYLVFADGIVAITILYRRNAMIKQ